MTPQSPVELEHRHRATWSGFVADEFGADDAGRCETDSAAELKAFFDALYRQRQNIYPWLHPTLLR
jgi:hypothetical protein